MVVAKSVEGKNGKRIRELMELLKLFLDYKVVNMGIMGLMNNFTPDP